MKKLNFIFLSLLIASSSCGKSKELVVTKPEVKPPAEIKGPIVKVMSYNIHIGNPPSKAYSVKDLPAIANVINLHKSDFVALSEVDKFTTRSGKTVDQAAELGRLTGMNYFFTKAMDHDGGEYGDAVLSRLPILDSKRFVLSTTSSSFEPRSLALILVEKEGKRFYFGSTHFDHTNEEDNRLLQAREVVNIIKNLEYPVILAGDWNSLPTSNAIKILTEVLTPTCLGDCPYTFPQIYADKTLDYIMYSPANKFKAHNLKIINETYASDHLPLTADIELK